MLGFLSAMWETHTALQDPSFDLVQSCCFGHMDSKPVSSLLLSFPSPSLPPSLPFIFFLLLRVINFKKLHIETSIHWFTI